MPKTCVHIIYIYTHTDLLYCKVSFGFNKHNCFQVALLFCIYIVMKKNSFNFIMKLDVCLSSGILSLCFKSPAFDPASRLEVIAQEDKTKLLKAAFLQYCR